MFPDVQNTIGLERKGYKVTIIQIALVLSVNTRYGNPQKYEKTLIWRHRLVWSRTRALQARNAVSNTAGVRPA